MKTYGLSFHSGREEYSKAVLDTKSRLYIEVN